MHLTIHRSESRKRARGVSLAAPAGRKCIEARSFTISIGGDFAMITETKMPAIKSLHHFAWRCRDAEETRHFYEDLLELPLVHLIKSDHVPSTGEFCPYVHIFFQM